MSVTTYDGSFSFRQNELAMKGFASGGMTAEQKALFMESPLMRKAREQEQQTWTMTADRDRKRAESDPSFKPTDDDFSAPKAFEYDRQVNYYKVLGVDEFAPQEEIKKSYKRLSLIYHPDKSSGLSAEEQEEHAAIFIELKNAYATLADNATRRQYDRDRDHAVSGAEINGYKKKADKASFDAAKVLKKLQEMEKPPGDLIDVEVQCKIEKFFYGGAKTTSRRRKARNKEGDQWEETKTFRIDVPQGAEERWSIKLKGGDMHADRQPDKLHFHMVSKPHPIVERSLVDLHVKKQVVLKPDTHIQPFLSMEVDSVGGRTIILFGRNPFYYAVGSGSGFLKVSILGEGLGKTGRLHFNAKLGAGSGNVKDEAVVVSVRTADTKIEFFVSVNAEATVEELKRTALDLIGWTDSTYAKVLKVSPNKPQPIPFYNEKLPIGDTRSVVLETRRRLYEFPMPVARAKELLGVVTAEVEMEQFREGLRKCKKAESNIAECSHLLDMQWVKLTRVASHYGYEPNRKGLWTAVQRALFVTKDDDDLRILRERLAVFGFVPKDAPKPWIPKRRKKQRPSVETFLFRNGLGPPKWTSEEFMPDPGSETDPDDTPGEQVKEMGDTEAALLGLGTATALASSHRRRHGTFAAAVHPQMVKRTQRKAEEAPVCDLELTPMFGHGESLQLYTKPTVNLYFYSNLKQAFLAQPGHLRPRPMFAIAISCKSGAKRRGREDWGRLKLKLLPLLRQTAFNLLAEARGILPRTLSAVPAYAEDKYSCEEGILVLKQGEDEGEAEEVDTGDDEAVSRKDLEEMLRKEGKPIIDFDDLENLEEVERLTTCVQEERREQRTGKQSTREVWRREARLEAKRREIFKAAEARALADPEAKESREEELSASIWKLKAQKAFKRGDYYLAQDFYSREILCLEREPDNSEALGVAFSNRSACFVKVRHFPDALADAKKAAELRPKWGRAWSRVGAAAACLASVIGTAEANNAWLKAVEIDPCAAHIDGLAAAVKLERQHPDTAHGDKEKGNEAARLKEWGKAIATYTVGIAKLPPSPKATIDVKVLGKKAAEDEYELLRTLIYSNRSAALAKVKAWELAAKDAEKAIESKEDVPQAHCRLGVALLGCGRNEEAYTAFAKALQLSDNKLISARKGREVSMSLIKMWESPSALRRRNRFLRDSHRPSNSTKIFCLSDIHYDHGNNDEWIHNINSTKFLDDVLIVAGNVADTRRNTIRCLQTLRAKFRRVFYVAGNHELWIHPSEKSKYPDSFCKLWSLIEGCDEIGVDTFPACVCQGVFIVPLLSWYNSGFDVKDPFPNPKLEPDKYCKWPIDPDAQVWRYMLALNREHLGKPYHGTVISFSHFVPRLSCPLWRGEGGLKKMSGCLELDEQVRDVRSVLHVYGHTHLRSVKVDEGVTYLHQHLGFEGEHLSTEPIMCIYNGKTTCNEMINV
mmetsp:Transcript_21290/g.39471  ORF Transcript_21290/g.39471 Transcript_21290/m.39471 type:complete len:1440 (+) Transcript_21290:135-4454(+)